MRKDTGAGNVEKIYFNEKMHSSENGFVQRTCEIIMDIVGVENM